MAKASKIVSLAAVLLLAALVLPFPLANMARANDCLPNAWVAPPPLGNDGNPGTQSQPFEHIQTGISNVCEGGTVYVAAGTYLENLSIDKTLNLEGAGAPTTIIDGGGCGRVMCISSVTGQVNNISGFTIQNGHIGWGAPLLTGGGGMPVGGGVYVATAHIVTLNDCTIKNNIADFLGGGVYNAGQITLNRCTVSGNSAAMVGGGIANFVDEKLLDSDGSMSLTNCTIYGNSVEQTSPAFAAGLEDAQFGISLSLGGGVYNGGDASFLNVTIANNTVSAHQVFAGGRTSFFSVPVAYAEPVIPEPHGGGFANVPLQCTNDEGAPIYAPVATFKNTIVANNVPENGYNDGGSVISLGYNLDSENSCGFHQLSDLVNADPLLGSLQDNGGPTFTCALLMGSPAIDAGTCTGAPSTDQRGITRPQGENCDIGAFELEYQIAVPPGPRVSPSPPSQPLNPFQGTIQFLTVSPQQTYANQPVTITTNVVNTGDEAGNLNIVLKINGLVEQSRMVGVGPQGTQPVKFTITKAQPGTYTVDILGEQGSFVVLGSGSTGGTPVNSGLIALLIMGVLVLATILVLVLTRRPA